MLKTARPDPRLDQFRDGIAVLRRGVVDAGHLVTRVDKFWSPGQPLTRQWCVWFTVIWANGERERPFEDYPPWITVEEVDAGVFSWDDPPHDGEYAFEWLTGEEREATARALRLRPFDRPN